MRTYILLAILTLLSVGYFANEWQKQPNKVAVPITKEQQPDFTAKGLDIKLFNQLGKPTAALQAEKMTYFTEQKQAQLSQSQYSVFGENADIDWRLSAQQSILTNNRHLELSEQVTVNASEKYKWLNQLQTDTLTLDLHDKTIASSDEITIDNQNLKLSGTGLVGNLDSQHFELKKNVHAIVKPN